VAPYPQTGYLLFRMLRAATSGGDGLSEPNWDALQAASESMGYKPGVARLREIICGQMADAPPNAGHEALVRIATTHRTCDVITTNYDLCLEKACINAGLPWQYTWQPNTGTDESLRLSKVHGSINLFVCKRCSRTREPSVQAVEETRSISVTCERGCGAAMSPLIVPPVRQKVLAHPTLIPAWYWARLALIEADAVVVAGYGFADADDYIASLFALDVLSVTTKRVVVFSTSNRATSKLESLRSRYSLDLPVSDQLTTVIGPCESTLPVVANRVVRSPRI